MLYSYESYSKLSKEIIISQSISFIFGASFGTFTIAVDRNMIKLVVHHNKCLDFSIWNSNHLEVDTNY